MLAKLEQLGAKSIRLGISEKNRLIQQIESTVGALPQAYKDVLLHFGGDIEFDAMIAFSADIPSPWASPDKTDSLEMLYGLTSKYGTSVIDVFDTYKGRIPAGWFAIGAAPGGNQICIHIGGTADGSIAFWDHESEVGPDMPKRSDGITLIAPNLEEFIARLIRESPSGDVSNDVKVDLRF